MILRSYQFRANKWVVLFHNKTQINHIINGLIYLIQILPFHNNVWKSGNLYQNWNLNLNLKKCKLWSVGPHKMLYTFYIHWFFFVFLLFIFYINRLSFFMTFSMKTKVVMLFEFLFISENSCSSCSRQIDGMTTKKKVSPLNSSMNL